MLGSTVAFSQPPTPLRQSFDVQVPWHPMPVVIDGQLRLVYEIHLTNFAADDLTLKQIEVLDTGSGSVLRDFREPELNDMIGRFDHSVTSMDRLKIPSGVRVIVYLSLPLPTLGASSIALTHRIEYGAVSNSGQRLVLQGGAFIVRNEPRVTLGSPLHGGPWIAVYDASWERGHRRVPFAIQGSVHVPGRFAIDWIKVDKEGKYFYGDGTKVVDWYGYGAEVLAVADSVVAATRDYLAESATVLKNPDRTEPGRASGNYIALDLGAGRYAFYEHLKPGSVRVKVGDHVERGRVIGLLGYTGKSTGPHLHFHVSDNNSPLDAEGLPYGLRQFKVLGRYPSTDAFGKSLPWSSVPAGLGTQRHDEFPAPFSVVDFEE
jgi:murein DD-endopeptidase MepM/ murein hydrolase activator NlpD